MDAYKHADGSVQVSDTLFGLPDAQLNGRKVAEGSTYTFGDLQIGTMIYTDGFERVKQKKLDGGWKEV